MKYIGRVFLCFITMLCVTLSVSKSAYANPPNNSLQLVNTQLHLFSDASGQLTIKDVINAFEQKQFVANTTNQVSFGFTENALWAVLEITQTQQGDKARIIKIDNAWLDELDIYFVLNGQVLRQVNLGDTSPFSKRNMPARMPALQHTFQPGDHQVYFRIKSQDPLTFPLYIGSEKSYASVVMSNAYFYGALYGALSILLIYNLALYAYLKERKYLFYSLYLLAFMAFNYTYTGFGFSVLWPESVVVQQGLMPTLMFVYILCGVAFTLEFLNTQTYLPLLYAQRNKVYGGLMLLALILLVIGDRSLAIMLQLVILTGLPIWMLSIAYYAYKRGNVLAKFFVPAVAMGTGGATISSLATWGVIPYSQYAFRGIEIGMLLEMSLLSISLGFNFKLSQDARKYAESEARLDPLTSLYNRRAFTDLVYPLWRLGARNNTPMAILLIDIDWFKRINDERGHSVGDEVLKSVGLHLKQCIRDSDIPLRWGGEEFLIFLPNTDTENALQIAEKLRAYFDSIDVAPATNITLSIGVTSALPNNIALDKLISFADQALYQAKQQGRNRVVSLDSW